MNLSTQRFTGSTEQRKRDVTTGGVLMKGAMANIENSFSTGLVLCIKQGFFNGNRTIFLFIILLWFTADFYFLQHVDAAPVMGIPISSTSTAAVLKVVGSRWFSRCIAAVQ